MLKAGLRLDRGTLLWSALEGRRVYLSGIEDNTVKRPGSGGIAEGDDGGEIILL